MVGVVIGSTRLCFGTKMSGVPNNVARQSSGIGGVCPEPGGGGPRPPAGFNAIKSGENFRPADDRSSAEEEIANLIKLIDEMAFQTNVLALNAAAEAADRGESGRGFAVAADDARRRSQRCADAAKAIVQKLIDSPRMAGRIVPIDPKATDGNVPA